MNHRARESLVTVLAVILFSTVVVAQDGDYSGITGEDMQRDADDRLVDMEETLDEVFALRDRTEEEDDSDVAKLRCINDKLAAIQGFLRLSADAIDSLSSSVRSSDRDGMEHQYSLVLIASQRVGNLRNEANQCAGEILTFSGEGSSETSVDPKIPDNEDLTASSDPVMTLERLAPPEPLPEATPFQ